MTNALNDRLQRQRHAALPARNQARRPDHRPRRAARRQRLARAADAARALSAGRPVQGHGVARRDRRIRRRHRRGQFRICDDRGGEYRARTAVRTSSPTRSSRASRSMRSGPAERRRNEPPAVKANANQIRAAIDAASPDIRLYLLHGPDESGAQEIAARLARTMGPDAERVDLESSTLKSNPGRLADEAASMSLFGSARHIRISGAGDECTEAFTLLLDAERAGQSGRRHRAVAQGDVEGGEAGAGRATGDELRLLSARRRRCGEARHGDRARTGPAHHRRHRGAAGARHRRRPRGDDARAGEAGALSRRLARAAARSWTMRRWTMSGRIWAIRR